MILKTENLSKHFGGLRAVDNLDFELEEGEVRGLIGPNGSGKSTFFNLVSGVYKPDPGSHVWLNGKDVTGMEPHWTQAVPQTATKPKNTRTNTSPKPVEASGAGPAV